MSNTDKDKPYWVTAEWWEPDHTFCPNHLPKPWQRGIHRECDLPARPVRRRPDRYRRGRQVEEMHCTWYPAARRERYCRVPGWYIQHTWTNPQRRQLRDDARRAVAEHRATGEVATEFSTGQHRHNASWYWN